MSINYNLASPYRMDIVVILSARRNSFEFWETGKVYVTYYF